MRSISGVVVDAVFPLFEEVLVQNPDGSWQASVTPAGFSVTLSGATLVGAAMLSSGASILC